MSVKSTIARGPRTWRRLGLGALATLLAIGALAVPAHAAAPVTVSLVFNDGLATQYRNAAPLLQSRGMTGTYYVASSWVKSNDAKYMRFYQLDELYRQGNEIGGMGKDHKSLTATYDPDPAADLAYKRDQVCGDHQALQDWGYHPVSFAYPGAAENSAAQSLVRDCGFTSGRVAGGLSAAGPVRAEPLPPANPMRLRALTTPPGAVTLQTLQDAVTAAGADAGGWLPIAFNDVCSSADASYATCMNGNKPVDATVLASFLDWLGTQASEGVSVSTVRQVMGAEQPPLPQRPMVVSLTFDDGLRSQYGLREIFSRHDVASTFYINSGAVDAGEAGTMTWDEIRDLQAAGHDVGGHTTNHINMLSTETSYEFKTRQTCDDRQRLLEEGLNAVSFAYPFGAMDATAQTFVRGCGYQSGRKAGTVTSNGPIYSETIPVTENPYAVRILGTNDNGPVTLEALQYAVNQAIAYGGSWLPTLYHQICYVGTPGYDGCMAGYRPVDDATIDAFLTWIESQPERNISVKTVADVMGGGSVAPRVAVTGPTNAATVSQARPELSGSATGDRTVSVAVHQGDYTTGAPVATLSAPVSNGTWSVRPESDLADGSYTVQASQPNGTASGSSVPVRFTVQSAPQEPLDEVAPTVSLTSPEDGSTLRTSTPTLQGSAGRDTGDLATVNLRYFAGSAASGTPLRTETVAVSSDGSWSTTAEALGDGVYTVDAYQDDQAGNRGMSAPVTFTLDTTVVDATAPTVTVTEPSDGETVTTATPTIAGTAGTADGDEAQVEVAVYSSAAGSDAVERRVAAVAADGSWSVATGSLEDGSYSAQVTQSDAAGNIGTSPSVGFTVATTPTDTTAPTVTITRPASGEGVGTADVVVAGTAGHDTGDAATLRVDVYAGLSATGTPAQSRTVAVTSDGAWQVSLTGLAAGTFTVRAQQEDVSGNVGTSDPVTFTRTSPPTTTSMTPSSLGQGATSASVVLDGTGFTASSQVTSTGGTSFVVSAWTATRLTLLATVASGAAVGARDVTVANADGSTARCSRCLSVVRGPRISSVSPATLRRGRTTTVTIRGSYFRAPSMVVAVSGTGVTVESTRLLSGGRMTAVLTVSSDAALTSRSLTVTDPRTLGQAVRTSAVTVVN